MGLRKIMSPGVILCHLQLIAKSAPSPRGRKEQFMVVAKEGTRAIGLYYLREMEMVKCLLAPKINESCFLMDAYLI
jgi:hypothetical protein